MNTVDFTALCKPCQTLVSLQDPANQSFHANYGYPHQETFAGLKASAENCLLCERFHKAYIAEIGNERMNAGKKYLVHEHFQAQNSLRALRDAKVVLMKIETKDRANHVKFLMMREGGKGHIATRAIWGPKKDMAFDERAAVIRHWIRECELDRTTHQRCFSKKPYLGLPTRLIDLDPGSESGYPRLVHTSSFGFAKKSVPYTTLSHRWGSFENRPLMTTKENEAKHKEGIPWESFPATFWDAIRITWALDARYVWIDSLCIVQDDTEDWQAEASQMSNVYRGSCLNIAALDAQDSDGGCFLDSIPPGLLVVGIPGIENIRIRIPAAKVQNVSEAQLNTRGWTFQELLLADRVLYCGKDQFFWQCRARSASEDGYLDIPKALNFQGAADWASKLSDLGTAASDERWWGWASDYARRDFTVESDRLAALAGITELHEEQQVVSSSIQTSPILGLWMHSLVKDLMWRVDEISRGSAPKPSGIPNIPSWTWLAFQHCKLTRLSNRGKSQAQVIEANVKWEKEPMTSRIISTKLVLEGRIATIEVIERGDCKLDRGSGPSYYRKSVSAPCLLLWSDSNRGFYDEVTFLILEEVAAEGNETSNTKYQRIGIRRMHIRALHLNQDFKDAPIQTVELV